MKKRKLSEKLLRDFEGHLRDDERSEATVSKYMHDVRCFAEFIGDGEITKSSVTDYKASLSESYAAVSANSMLAALNSFLRYSGLGELCVKRFRIQREAFCPEEKELTREEYIRLVKTAEKRHNARLCLIIQTICGTGIRVSELEYITVDSVTRGEASVSCKGKNRRIFIVPELKKKLLAYIKEERIAAGAVFVTRGGKPISRSNIWREMKALCKEARVAPSKVFPHNLRHLFARTFYGIEKDIAKLADILGHSSIDTTRIYIVTTSAEHRRKMQNMRLIL